jgi:rare lipoprotein A
LRQWVFTARAIGHTATLFKRAVGLGFIAKARNLKNRKEVEVKVIDRRPFKEGRVLDLSEGAARKLGMIGDGVVPVEAVVLRCGD